VPDADGGRGVPVNPHGLTHGPTGAIERSTETLDVRAVCLCGEAFEDNDRDAVVTALMLHLSEAEGWLTA
jgi:hypothetical protein